jgi:mxaJ protein
MNNRIQRRHATGLMLSSAVMLLGLASPLWAVPATPETPDPSVLRVCASTVETPYSSKDGEGFENKIAKVLANAMGRKVSFVWSEKPAIYSVRDQLDAKTCDVVIGLDTGDERVLTTKPYYRAPYVFIVRKDSPLDIKGWDSPDLLKAKKVAIAPDGPAQVMLEKLGLFNTNFNYIKSLTGFKSKRNQYVRIEPQRFVDEVASGKADLAIVFGPEVGRYAKQRGDQVKLVVVPDNATRGDGQHVPFHFDQSIGVRKDDKELLSQVEAALQKARPEIETILKEEGMPLDEVAKTPEGRAG